VTMKTSAVATNKRRSMLPAPKSFSAGATVAASSKTDKVPTGRTVKEASAVSGTSLPSDKQPAGSKVVTSTVVGDSSNEAKGGMTLGKLGDGECHGGSELRQTQLQKPSNLQLSAAASRKRPSSASSVLNRGTQEANRSSSSTKTSPDSGSSVKLTAAAVGSQNTETKNNRLFHSSTGTSVPASHSAYSSTKQRQLPRSAELTTRKLKAPSRYVSSGTAAAKSCSPEIDVVRSQTETVSVTGPLTEIPPPENTVSGTGIVQPESSSAEDGFGGTVEEECDISESLSSAVPVADIPDVLSRVTSVDRANDDCEQLASSSGSLGILDDTDLLNTSLLSLDSSSAPSTARMNDEEADDVDTLSVPAAELDSKQSSSASEIDPSLRSEVNVSSLRPLSLMSNSSTDMGIVADCMVYATESRSQQERPSSYMSTSSVDTGMSLLNSHV